MLGQRGIVAIKMCTTMWSAKKEILNRLGVVDLQRDTTTDMSSSSCCNSIAKDLTGYYKRQHRHHPPTRIKIKQSRCNEIILSRPCSYPPSLLPSFFSPPSTLLPSSPCTPPPTCEINQSISVPDNTRRKKKCCAFTLAIQIIDGTRCWNSRGHVITFSFPPSLPPSTHSLFTFIVINFPHLCVLGAHPPVELRERR